jgi:hypothetical protein
VLVEQSAIAFDRRSPGLEITIDAVTKLSFDEKSGIKHAAGEPRE